ncbi:hypothetical protein JRO89_XS06G0103800 [Xanthoceras sorbifolium]|uniref:Gnk2-homologous domain-containing protein n=1 Tax=Xanthoceras sorbifolium TaxID=99658 RepID=A0ABQ8HXK3_9ROSI|nr:hypothetical protein JRO89_XS06G0103800 [Xanthoceras sorbifolium]
MEILSSRSLLFLSCVLHIVTLTASQPNFLHHYCLSNKGNCVANTTYSANLKDQIISSISSNSEISYGFYSFSVSQNSDNRLNVIASCRGDIKPDACHSCLNDSVSKLINLCCNYQEAIGYYEKCKLRFSNRSISQSVKVTPRFAIASPQNLTIILNFQSNQSLMTLLNSLRSKAASGGSLRKFAAGNMLVSQNTRVYALVQCTPDLSQVNCTNCLGTIAGRIQYCCDDKEGASIYAPSCELRFELRRFYDPTVHEVTVLSPSLSSTNTTTLKGNDDNISRTVIIIVVPVAAFMILIISICIIYRVKNFKEKITKIKSDVFSFGVLVLELVSGQRRSCSDTEEEIIECLLTHAWKKWNEGTTSNLIDPTLREGSRNDMLKCIHIGLLCVQESVSDRPTMASVIHMLNSDSVTLAAPAKPGFFMQSSAMLNASSSLEHNSGSTESDRRRIATAPL